MHGVQAGIRDRAQADQPLARFTVQPGVRNADADRFDQLPHPVAHVDGAAGVGPADGQPLGAQFVHRHVGRAAEARVELRRLRHPAARPIPDDLLEDTARQPAVLDPRDLDPVGRGVRARHDVFVQCERERDGEDGDDQDACQLTLHGHAAGAHGDQFAVAGHDADGQCGSQEQRHRHDARSEQGSPHAVELECFGRRGAVACEPVEPFQHVHQQIADEQPAEGQQRHQQIAADHVPGQHGAKRTSPRRGRRLTAQRQPLGQRARHAPILDADQPRGRETDQQMRQPDAQADGNGSGLDQPFGELRHAVVCRGNRQACHAAGRTRKTPAGERQRYRQQPERKTRHRRREAAMPFDARPAGRIPGQRCDVRP